MKRWLVVTLIVLAALAILIAVLVLTPVGHGPARRILEDVVRDAAGYELSVSDLSGNLLSRIIASDVRLTSADGVPLVEADRIVVDFELLPLLDRTVSVPLLRFENARTWFLVSEKGSLLGWTDVPRDTTAAATDTSAASEPWTVSASVVFDGLEAVYADSAAPFSITADLDRLTATGGIDAFDAVLEGRVLYEGVPFERPLDVMLSIEGGLEGTSVGVSSLELESSAADISASGSVGFPPSGTRLDVTLGSELRAEALAGLLGSRGVRGAAELKATVSGPVDSLRYDAAVRSDGLRITGVPIESLTADVEGVGGQIRLSSLSGRALDGTFGLSGAADLTGRGGGRIVFDASGSGIELARVPGVDLAGSASFDAAGEAPTGRLSAAAGTLRVDVRALGVEGRSFGDAAIRAGLLDGKARARALCCSTALTATAKLVESGVESLAASVEARDLGEIAGALDIASLEGRAVLEVRAPSLTGETLRYTGRLPEVSYGGVSLGPAELEGVSEAGRYDIAWSLLDGVATGTAVVDVPGARYTAAADVDGLELRAVLPDSLLEPYEAGASVSLEARVEGTFDGGLAAGGRVTALDGGVRGEDVALEAPFSFEATTERVTVSPVRLSGSFGSFAVGGTVTAGDSLDVAADLDRLDMAVVDRIARGRVRGPGLSGFVSGSLDVRGSRRAPVASLNVSTDSLSAAGVSFAEAAIEADVDSSMVVFSLSAVTEDEGALLANGMAPVRPDPAAFLAIDRDREFALSLTADGFSADLGELVLTGTRGPKMLRIDGSVLVTGLVDSLASVNGRGDLNELSLALAPARVALADSFSFEIDGGDIWLENLVLDVTRTRVLTEAAGGRLVASGFIGVRDSVDVSVRVDSLDVATLFRVVSPGPATPLAGRLDLSGAIRGRLSAPAVEARWSMDRPRIVGLGFDSFDGLVHTEGERVVLDHATLRSAGDSLTVTGSVGPSEVGPDAEEAAPRPVDFAVTSGGIDLSRLSALPPGVDEAGGTFTADIAVGGTTGRPTFEGTVGIADGRFLGFGMVEPARGIELEVAALGRAFSLQEAVVELGSGRITADGTYDLASNGSFRLRARLDAPEIRITDVLDARLGGRVAWAGDRERSSISGGIDIEKADVFYEFSLAELASRRVRRVAVRASEDPRSRIGLDLEIDVDDVISFSSNLAELELSGGMRLAGTLLRPRPTGSFYTESGTFQYLGTEFELETLNVSWRDPRRSDPYISLLARADVEARSGDSYSVTITFDDYWYDGTFGFTSSPPLSEPDIIALLTFGDTVGGVVSGGDRPGTSRSSFSEIARKTFVGRVFGVAESTLEDLLDLDVVAIDEETTEEGSLVEGAGVTVGKRFGRVAISYTTAVGRFEEREVEVSFFLTDHLSLVTRADPGGNHAARIKLHIPIE